MSTLRPRRRITKAATWYGALLLALLGAGAAHARRGASETALRHFRAAWGRFHLSASLPNAALANPADAVTMRQQAIREMHGAVALAPEEGRFLESLGYLYAANGQADKAESWYRRAAAASPREPRVPYLLGRLHASGLDQEGADAAELSAQADRAYGQALRLDSGNGLLLIEAAHVLHRVGLDARARERLEGALYRTRYRLYTLPAPPDLMVEQGSPAAAWFSLQQQFWAPALSRAYEVAQWSVSLGRAAEQGGRLGAAESHYHHAVALGRSVARAEPRTLAAAVVGLRCEEAGLGALVALQRKRGGAADVRRLERVRSAKEAALRALAQASAGSATSVNALLERQAHEVERILAQMEQSP